MMHQNIELFLTKAVELLASQSEKTEHVLSDYWLFSASDGNRRAKTMTIQATRFQVSEFLMHFQKLEKKFEQPIKWLKLERIDTVQELTWATFKKDIQKYKRNYFRKGLAFWGKTDNWLLCSEMELNAHACLYAGADTPMSQVNMNNLTVYLKARHGSSKMPDFDDAMTVLSFDTKGIFYDAEENKSYELSSEPREHGRRKMPPLDAQNSQPIITNLITYLGNQVNRDGSYVYGYFPVFGRTINTYNTLRHASSTYALIEGYEFCRTTGSGDLIKLKEQIETALEGLINKFIRHYQDGLAYVIEINDEIKLGANAVAILALVKYIHVFSDSLNNDRYLRLANALAEGIAKMQQPDGSFVHILSAKDLSVVARSRIIYYDGEAAFGLMRLYGLTKNERWLDIVKKAFDYFILAGHSQAHDHWLSYCSNELVQHCPDEKYFRFAVDNVKGYTNFIEQRITTFPTLLELSMAFHKMLLKLDEFPQFSHVLEGFDVADFYRALHTRANYLLNGVFFPEVAMFYKLPSTILWGGFIRHHSFRVRIDDVEHYLSGLIAYYQLLSEGRYPKSAQQNDHALVLTESALTPKGIVAATRGKWTVAPSDDWYATGLAIYPAGFKPGCLLVARGKNMKKGYLPLAAIRSFIKKGAGGIVTDDPELYLDMGVPVLQVSNVRAATLGLGGWSRKYFSGRVVGITGSAGKTTTVAMMAGALHDIVNVGSTVGSANLPIGIAWNMASLPLNADYWVLEMAIGQMSTNSELARPDIAVITNIAAAHLEYHGDVETIARKKSQIFSDMPKGSYAVICRDIAQYELIAEQARLHGLNIISYGESKEADMVMLSYQQGVAEFRLNHDKFTIKFETLGKHIALNALAVLTVAHIDKLPIDSICQRLAQFKPVQGRGNVMISSLGNKKITVHNEAYNANPLSMKAALDAFIDHEIDHSRKVIVIGDMLELGPNSGEYHHDIVSYLSELPVDRIVLVGEQMTKHQEVLLKKSKEIALAKDQYEAKSILERMVRSDDHILLKASNGIGLHSILTAQ